MDPTQTWSQGLVGWQSQEFSGELRDKPLGVHGSKVWDASFQGMSLFPELGVAL